MLDVIMFDILCSPIVLIHVIYNLAHDHDLAISRLLVNN